MQFLRSVAMNTHNSNNNTTVSLSTYKAEPINANNDIDIILEQMVIIDKAKNIDELNSSFTTFLKSIGEYTNANHVYAYDCNTVNNSYQPVSEWYPDNNISGKTPLYNVNEQDIPYLHNKLCKAESIIIDDIDTISNTMPSEYRLLEMNNVKTAIIFPIMYKDELRGFIGIDNPKIQQSSKLIHMLKLIGLHIGSAHENLLMDALLNQRKTVLRDSLTELRNEKMILSALCLDYTSVYSVNLYTEETEIIKLDFNANASKDFDNIIVKNIKYSDMLKLYYDKYVIKDESPDFLNVLSSKNLLHELSYKERFIYHYKTTPNNIGKEYFEVQVIPMQKDTDAGKVIIGFRHIDDIVRDEQKQQHKLQAALDAAKLNNQIISAISKIYFAIYRIALKNDFYEEITSDNEVHSRTGHIGKASTKMIEICDSFVADEYHDRVLNFFDLSTLSRRLKNEETVAVEYLAKDGNWHLARFIAKKRDDEGNVTHVLYVMRLISEEKKREQSFILIAEAANKANEAKSDFLSRMAHDIRTPMNAIMGYVDITKEEINNPKKVAENLKKIDIAGKYLQQLVNDILDISSIENGRFSITPKEVCIDELFDTFTNTVSNIQQDKNIAFSYNKKDIKYNYIIADELRLKQICMNLISNAFKYTPDGGKVSLEISEKESENKNKVILIFVISDTGIGIHPDFINEMYSKFSRQVDTRVNKVRGSGLGLAIVKQLIDLMDGDIKVDSEVGKGTTFYVTLEVPYIIKENKAKAISQNIKETATRDMSCAGMNLLIAEDNDFNYDVIMQLLNLHGINCVHAVNGAECVDLFKNNPPHTYDAILMDMQMPVMDGPCAARVIRNLSRPDSDKIPIIAITANAFANDIDLCLSSGMNEHLAKPLYVPDLIAILKKYTLN